MLPVLWQSVMSARPSATRAPQMTASSKASALIVMFALFVTLVSSPLFLMAMIPNSEAVGTNEHDASMTRSLTVPTSVNKGAVPFQFLMLWLLPLKIPGNVAQVGIVFPVRSMSAVRLTTLVASAVVSSFPLKSLTNSSAVAMSLGNAAFSSVVMSRVSEYSDSLSCL